MKTRNRIEFFDWNIVTPETSKIRKTCLKKHDLSGPKYNDTHVQKYVLDPVQNSVTLSSKNNSRKFFQQYFRSGIHGIHESVRDSQNFVGPGPARSQVLKFFSVLVRAGPESLKFFRSWSGPGPTGFSPWIPVSAIEMSLKSPLAMTTL